MHPRPVGSQNGLGGIDLRIPAPDRAVLRCKDEDRAGGVSIQGDVELAGSVSDHPRWGTGSCTSARRWDRHDQALFPSHAVIESGFPGAVVGNPERARRQRRDAPGVDLHRICRVVADGVLIGDQSRHGVLGDCRRRERWEKSSRE